MELTKRTLPATKNIALVAHDNCKQALIEWCKEHSELLAIHNLYGTGTTSHLLQKATGLHINPLLSGPMGGDQQLGAMITNQEIDMLIFFWDTMNSVPHDPDVKALLRISTVWNIPIAMNQATANFLINSPSFAKEFDVAIPDYQRYFEERTKK